MNKLPNQNYLSCSKPKIKHLTICIVVNGEKNGEKWEKSSSCELYLDPTMPNVELLRGIFISYSTFKFQELRSNSMSISSP